MIVSLAGWVIGFRKIKNVVNGQVSFWLIISSLIYLFGIYAWNLLFWKSHGFSFGIQGDIFPQFTGAYGGPINWIISIVSCAFAQNC